MRIIYLTAHLSDVDVAQSALEKQAGDPVSIEACASVGDVTRRLADAPADGIVVDVAAANAEAVQPIHELRAALPDLVIVALVRTGGTARAAEALVAGADDTLEKHREFFLHLPATIAQARAKRLTTSQREAHRTRVLMVDAPLELVDRPRLFPVAAPPEWWTAPVEHTTIASVEVVVVDDRKGATAVVTAIRTLRDAGRTEPVVIITDTADREARNAYQRVSVAACLARNELTRLPDAIERAAHTAHLEHAVAALRAKEERLRALVESIPTSVALVAADGTVQAVNLAGLRLIGARDATQIVGRPFTTLCDEHDTPNVKAFVVQVCEGTPGAVRFSGRGLDGEPHVFEFRSVPLRRNRDSAAALGVMRAVAADSTAPAATPSVADADIAPDGRTEPTPREQDPVFLERLRVQLEVQQQSHDGMQARLDELDAQRAVSEAAWLAVQAELERKLAGQVRRAALDDEREASRANLEASLREREAQVLALEGERDATAARARELLAARTADVDRLQGLVLAADAARAGLEATVATHEARLAEIDVVHERDLEDLRTALLAASTERERAIAETAASAQNLRDELDGLWLRHAALEHEHDAAQARLHDAGERERLTAQALADMTCAHAQALSTSSEVSYHLEQLTTELADQRAAAQAKLEDERSLRDAVAQAHAQLEAHRRGAAELEGEQLVLREALRRADAGAQLIVARHRDERDAVQRTLEEVSRAGAAAAAQWAAQRAELERALTVKAEAHRRLAESGVLGVATTTSAGILLHCNDALARFCGYAAAADLLTHPEGTLVPLPVDWLSFARHLAAASGPLVVESCVQHPDGRITWLQAAATPVREDASAAPLVEWTVVDATDRYLRMRQLKHGRRLDAIRELAVSAGHEVATLLAGASRSVAAGDAVASEGTLRAMARAREIAQQLAAFAQRQARLPQLLDLNETLRQLRPTLRRLCGDEAVVDTAMANGPLVVSADPSETEQWLTTLMVACRDALPAGGTLTLATRSVDLALGGTEGERRFAPVAQVSFVACGLGARPVSLSASLSESLAHRGGALRPSHDVAGSTTRVDVYLPLVRPTRAAEAPFPLLRSDATAGS